jgi:hypothetical protein
LNVSDESGSPLRIAVATIAGLLATLAAGISVTGWVAPSLLSEVADWVMAVGFLIVFLGTGGTLIVVWANGLETSYRKGGGWLHGAPRLTSLFLGFLDG